MHRFLLKKPSKNTEITTIYSIDVFLYTVSTLIRGGEKVERGIQSKRWFLLGLLMMMCILTTACQRQMEATLDYPTFLQKLENGQIDSVQWDDASILKATTSSGDVVWFDHPRLPDFKHQLLIGGVSVQEMDMTPNLFGALFVALAIVIVLIKWRRRSPANSFAKGDHITMESSIPTTRFLDVAANEEALQSMRDLISFIREPEQYAQMGARIPRGVLLYGMPGTGKTLLARALAGEANVPFFAVNGADFMEMYVGVGASRIRSLFEKAKKAKNAVIFIDEIDAIGKRRDNRSDEREQTLNALLSEMSGFELREGIVVLAATNRIDVLDEALLRAGRFDRHVEVPLPSLLEREKILQVHARNKPFSADISFHDIAMQTTMFSGAKLENMLNEAAILAVKRQSEIIQDEDIHHALDLIVFGAEKTHGQIRPHERNITAAHEAGHALMTAVLLPTSEVKKVSIIPTAKGAAGYSMAIAPEQLFHQKQELLHHMAVALAGREAEALLVGKEYISTGASNDIEKAVTLAKRMVDEWGMMPNSDDVYLFCEQHKDAAAQQWLQKAKELAMSVLLRHQIAWEHLTARLLTEEVVDGSVVLDCLQL